MTDNVSFFLNGKPVTVVNPEPDLLLIDYLRSPEMGLTGAKKGCGQGGCGACTVILSQWDKGSMTVEHRSINSCLRPVCALGGLSITTIEGTGTSSQPPPAFLNHIPTFSRFAAPFHAPHPPRWLEARKAAARARRAALAAATHSDAEDELPDKMNPVAHRLAENNGTQCGYCTPGFVMNMSAFLAANPSPTKREIEAIFDGNICRCTGYRPILTGMKTFAVDWSEEDEEQRMKCLLDEGAQAQAKHGMPIIHYPNEAKTGATPVSIQGKAQRWLAPETLAALKQLMKTNRGKTLRLVHGNTSFGIYPEEFHAAELLLDIRLIPNLYGYTSKPGWITVGASTTYSDFVSILAKVMEENNESETSRIGAMHFMARRTAGMIVRNAATLAGNTMLVLKHIRPGTGAPFPSDLVTALVAVDAQVDILKISTGRRANNLSVEKLVKEIRLNPDLADDIVLLRYHLPYGQANEVVLAQKVALREVNAHSIVNGTSRFVVGERLNLDQVVLVYGGIAPYPWRPQRTEAELRGNHLTLDNFASIAQTLKAEILDELAHNRERMATLPNEGFSDEYRANLAVAFLYKAIINALQQKDHDLVPLAIQSSGAIKWGHWPVSDGQQNYKTQSFKEPVAQPYIKLEAMRQASGQVHYTHEIALPPTGVNAAFVLSRQALANYYFVIPNIKGEADTEAVREHLREKFDSFVDVITHEQIPTGGINYQGMGSDQPLFAVDQVWYVGQAIALVLAKTEQQAIAIADYVTRSCVHYKKVEFKTVDGKPVRWPEKWYEPIITLEQAIAKGSIYPDTPETAPFISHVWKITRPGSQFDWITFNKDPLERTPVERRALVDGSPCLIVEGAQLTGGQAHFYMETQACVATPLDGERILIQPSSQSPMAIHQSVAMALGVEHNRVEVSVRQLGGAYGGKTEQARFVAGAAAVAANACQRPVRLVMEREADTSLIGKRHPYYGQYQIAVDLGENSSEHKGIIRGLHSKMWGDGGVFYDCSFVVANNVQLRVDNAYSVRNFENQLEVCRTNTAPNTAFRAFGDIQAQIILENAIDDVAVALSMPVVELREKNLYQQGEVTPFGQALPDCYMRAVWAYLKEKCEYERKVEDCQSFNADNRWRKRGVAMIPIKYGSGYNLIQLEQASALVSVYAGDGTVIINQGGVDMGQGNITQATQIAAYILNIPMHMIYVESARTSVIPNPTGTGASTGTAYNGEAIKQACQVLHSRLMEFGYKMRNEQGDAWCKQYNIDFWNYGENGWQSQQPGTEKHPKLIWQNLVQLAYQNRVSLVANFQAQIRGGTTPVPALQFKPKDQQPSIPGIEVDQDPKVQPGGAVDEFTGFTYSAACSVVELDVLTGEVKILSSDIVYDMGWSLNPAIDIGQVEGAFVQGIGYLLTEKLVFEEYGPDKGRLNTVNTWTYKPPAITTIPLEMNVHLFPRDLANVPENPNTLFSSKEVGEPPLVLATSVFFAVKDAIRATRHERGLPVIFRLDAPATVQEVRRACEVLPEHLNNLS